ncbi:hypothetical protein H4R35_001111 [Dimargaris xerosporica]|nr:hypothetical protein H4R35_001111 [Dimargaris xerosporica]
MADLSLSQFTRRPNYGTAAVKNIRVTTNYLELTNWTKGDIYHYDVTIEPELKTAAKCRRVFEAYEKKYRQSHFGGAYPVYDGRKNLYAPRQLPLPEGKAVEVYLPEDAERLRHLESSKGRKPKPFQVTIKFATKVGMAMLHEFIHARTDNSSEALTSLTALDVLFHHLPASKHPSVRNSFFTPREALKLSGCVEAWPGMYQSVRPTADKLLLNVDVASCVFYSEGPMTDFVMARLHCRDMRDVAAKLSRETIKKLGRQLRRVPITVSHRSDSSRTFIVRDVLLKTPRNTKFSLRGPDGSETTTNVQDYFEQTLNYRLQWPFLPCIEVDRGVIFPMEVCHILPGHRYPHKLDEKQTAEMIRFSCTKPFKRFERIRNGYQHLLDFSRNPYLRDFGIGMGRDCLSVEARVLATPKVVYGQGSRDRVVRPMGGAWNMRDKQVYHGATISSWSVLVLDLERGLPRHAVGRFMGDLARTFRTMGIHVNASEQRIPVVYGSPSGNIAQSMMKAWTAAKTEYSQIPDVVFVVLPTTLSTLYGEVKRVSDTMMGVPTQCMQKNKVGRSNVQYIANVGLKVNVKLGGINSVLDANELPFGPKDPTLVIGADVTHPSPGMNSQPSVAAVVSSTNFEVTTFTSQVRFQPPRQEMIDSLATLAKQALMAFYASTRTKPRRILVYRDGVSEGQFATVMEVEVNAIREACAKLEAGYQPKITFVTCQKRHHTRFLPQNQSDADRSGNCPPGTVVDSRITHPFEFDFFLQAHSGIQGTSRPVHYTVLHDESKYTADELQNITNRLCYLFPRCTRSVSLCPPAYFADILAARARFHRKNSLFELDDSVSSRGAPGSEAGVFSPPHEDYKPVTTTLIHRMYYM